MHVKKLRINANHKRRRNNEIKYIIEQMYGKMSKKWSITPKQNYPIVVFLLLAMLFGKSIEATDRLLGDLQSCTNEGEEVQIEGIQNSNCFKCMCQNGFVNCDKESCPSIDDCYLLDPKAPDACCRKCKGCIFRGSVYPSGSEWIDPKDPCRIYKCVASVITETVIKCFTQCEGNKLTPPRPGECCPNCQGCKIDGQIIVEGQEVIASIDDRCVVCQCLGGRLTCAKKTCPILQCPISKQKQSPNECCPRCTEHRELMPVSGKCIFNNKVYYGGTEFTPDRCTNCTCINGTSVCQRLTCPILECAPQYQEMHGCCPRCIVSEMRSECVYAGRTYENDETWNLSPCRSCRCTAGNIRCSEVRCAPLKCKGNEERIVPDGQCCPVCSEIAGTCTVFGDPHFKTFDGKFFNFQGSCKYLLTADCNNHTFSIRLTNDARGTKRSSWPKTITFRMKGIRVNLGQNLRVKINGSRITVPYSHGSILSVERLPETIVLKTDLGIQVEWDGNNFLQVLMPASYKHKLCGLCGNFNGVGRDDLIGRDGTNHTEPWRFANSWKVGGPKACSRKVENIAAQPTCKQRKSNLYCRQLRELFGSCDTRLNPINYIESCKMDVCECPTGLCHCDSFSAYAHECKRLGVELLDWRSISNCTLGNWKRTLGMTRLPVNNRSYNNNNSNSSNSSSRFIIDDTDAFISQQRKHNRRRKLHEQQQDLQQHLQNNHLLQYDYMTKHIPKNLLIPKNPDRTPLPLH